MPDAEWTKVLGDFLERCGLGRQDQAEAAPRLVSCEYYKLAYVQWRCGASRRVVDMLLQRALRESQTGVNR